jgi:hypothetical protein
VRLLVSAQLTEPCCAAASDTENSQTTRPMPEQLISTARAVD